jgi:hypothetical protein
MRRNWLVVAAFVALAVIVVAVVLARVTEEDSGGVETSEWASSVCSSLSDWRSSLNDLVDVSASEVTPEALQESLDEAGSATEELVSELRDLGPPDLETGDEVEQALDDAAEGLNASYESLSLAVREAVDAATPTEFLQAVAGIADDLQALVAQAGETVAALQSASLFGEASAELEQAFAEADSCQELSDQTS